jgi:hypothetical protein
VVARSRNTSKPGAGGAGEAAEVPPGPAETGDSPAPEAPEDSPPAEVTVDPQPSPESMPVEAVVLAPPGSDPAGSPPPAADEPAENRAREDEPPPPPPPPAEGSGRGFLAGLLGGALAAAAAAGALWAWNPDILAPQAAPAFDAAPLVARIEGQQETAAALESQIGALQQDLQALREAEPPAPPPPDTGATDQLAADVAARLDEIAAAIASADARIDVIEGRVAQVEARPPVVEAGGAEEAAAEAIREMRAALDAQRAEMAALADEARGRIEAAESEAAELQGSAREAARAAVARAALSRIQAAMDAGGPFAGALGDLTGATEVQIPQPLIAAADRGVPTLATLQRSFPDAARAGLSASVRAQIGDGATAWQRFGAFFRAQTGARPTTPRDGDDADALLSRAEVAVNEGRLADALDLVAALPEPGRAAMSDWTAATQTRLEAIEAVRVLAAALSES